MLHSELRLFQTPGAVIVAPANAPGAVLKIDRSSSQINFVRKSPGPEMDYDFALQQDYALFRDLVIESTAGQRNFSAKTMFFQNADSVTNISKNSRQIFGIVGLFELTLDRYLIVVTEKRFICRIINHNVFQAAKFELVPIRLSPRAAKEDPNERNLISLLETLLKNYSFYFSYTMDITSCMQRASRNEKDSAPAESPLWKKANDKFFWNKFAMKLLIDAVGNNIEAGKFIMPMMMGFFEAGDVKINDSIVRLILVSRRSRFRNGTRLFSRGIDDLGQTSNFNETEQIAIIQRCDSDPIIFSFNQIRGSIPLRWHHILDFTRKPLVSIGTPDMALESAMKHFKSLIGDYGNIHIINLIANKDGYEQALNENFEALLQQLNLEAVIYHYFNFNCECKNMQWQNIQILVDALTVEFEKQQYFAATGREYLQVIKEQDGIFRTNCLDCLDRTNVVQCCFARKMLTTQLREAGVISQHQMVESFPLFEHLFRNIWADNADAVSRIYSGTSALKTGFTRTGHRTILGLLNDGRNSAYRYLRAYLLDWKSQDAFDLFLGDYSVKDAPSKVPFQPDYSIFNFVGQCITIALALMLVSRLAIFSEPMSKLLWKCSILLILFAVLRGGLLFYAKKASFIYYPRLLKLDYVMSEAISKGFSGKTGSAGPDELENGKQE